MFSTERVPHETFLSQGTLSHGALFAKQEVIEIDEWGVCNKGYKRFCNPKAISHPNES